MSTDVLLRASGGVLSGRRAGPPPGRRAPGSPLIVALHGGSYSSAYFDVPGFSLLDRAAARGCVAVALDRPGYRASTLLEAGDSLLDANVHVLDRAVAELWRREGVGASGIVLVGHSIGAALATLLAVRDLAWPLRGIALVGVGLSLPPHGPVFEEDQPATTRLEVPDEVKNAAMFGPPGSYAPDAPARAGVANEPVVYREVAEINTRWSVRAPDVYARVRVPVHYRQGENDLVWTRGAGELDRVRAAFSAAPTVDARLVADAGHAVDFHHAGEALHDDQIGFAIACGAATPSVSGDEG